MCVNDQSKVYPRSGPNIDWSWRVVQRSGADKRDALMLPSSGAACHNFNGSKSIINNCLHPPSNSLSLWQRQRKTPIFLRFYNFIFPSFLAILCSELMEMFKGWRSVVEEEDDSEWEITQFAVDIQIVNGEMWKLNRNEQILWRDWYEEDSGEDQLNVHEHGQSVIFHYGDRLIPNGHCLYCSIRAHEPYNYRDWCNTGAGCASAYHIRRTTASVTYTYTYT